MKQFSRAYRDLALEIYAYVSLKISRACPLCLCAAEVKNRSFHFNPPSHSYLGLQRTRSFVTKPMWVIQFYLEDWQLPDRQEHEHIIGVSPEKFRNNSGISGLYSLQQQHNQTLCLQGCQSLFIALNVLNRNSPEEVRLSNISACFNIKAGYN